MHYYRCYIEVKMKDDGTLHSPDEISGMVDELFEDSDVPRMTGKYIYDFISLKLTLAGENVLRKIPYFKRCQWSQCSVTAPARTRWCVERGRFRLFMEEIKPQHVDIETRFYFFEGLCDLIDHTRDEHVVHRQKTLTSRAEMIAKDEAEEPRWALLYDKSKSAEDSDFVRKRLGLPKKESLDETDD